MVRDKTLVALTVCLVAALIAVLVVGCGGSSKLSGTQLSIDDVGVVIDSEGKWVGDPADLLGPQGIQGLQGEKGDKGDTGDKGEKGDTGAAGAAGLQGPQGYQGPPGVGYNPMQIALLRWYSAIETGGTFTVGSGPFGIAL